ncbi:MAG TPA: cob(I)yrinic acid a,c-diamide adenosyltransferase [Gaiellaceae bacterium]|nr:cob(I)yrinic acid a,c-diamide adenosyltransferase [Gaiellaceae bacterium]
MPRPAERTQSMNDIPESPAVPRRRDEPVRLTRIYTRGGDRGQTSLGDGSRVSKLDPLVRAYGAVDELNSMLGWATVVVRDPRLTRIQNELFDLGADLSVPFAEGDGKLRVEQAAIDRLEAECDEANEPLPDLKSFVLPGGAEAGARLHVARAVCRRVESVVLWAAAERPVNPLVPVYLNRLSDLLFILARAANTAVGDEPLWLPGGER